MRSFDAATAARISTALTVAVVLAGTLLSGPVLGVFTLDGPVGTDQLGDGTATVSSVSVDADRLVISDGRFGTGMAYLRVPDAVVDVERATGNSRLIYRLEVPALEIDTDSTAALASGRSGTHRLRIDDPAFEHEDVTAERYTATVAVRVQSFAVDETLYRENVTVEVTR